MILRTNILKNALAHESVNWNQSNRLIRHLIMPSDGFDKMLEHRLKIWNKEIQRQLQNVRSKELIQVNWNGTNVQGVRGKLRPLDVLKGRLVQIN